jgi:4-aminobutyrate aminotransferase-like enzyme
LSFPRDDVEPRANYKKRLARLAADHPGEIALFITEPYLGAAGSYHPPKWYHQMVQSWCNKHGIPLIFDEIQSCHGRTGNMYAYETYGVTPDLVVLGKGLGNGEPVAAVAGRADILDALEPGDASDTFSGNPRACAAVVAALEAFKSENVLRHARARAAELRAMLDALKGRFAFIKAVRGEGMVYGLEMASDVIANQCVVEAYLGNGKKGIHFIGPLAGTVLRVCPPLVISAKELDEAYKLLRDSWSRVGPAAGG